MTTDETQQAKEAAGPATPNRTGRRPPPLIEGEAARVVPPAGEAGLNPQASDAAPAPPWKLRLPEGVAPIAGASLASAILAAILVYAVTPSGDGGNWAGALEARLSAVERQARDAARRAGEAGDAVRKLAEAPAPQTAPAALEQRLAALEKAFAAPKDDARATEDKAASAPAASDLDPMRRQIGALEQRLQALEGRVAPVAQAAEGWDARLRAAEERMQPLTARVEDARKQIETGGKRAEELATRALDAARLALAQSIVGAIETGAPFAAQAEALARLGAPAEKLKALKNGAASGAATLPELARAFAALEDKAAARPEPGPDASVVDRLAASAAGLIRVRPAGEPAGDAPADVAARVRRALERGDLPGALAAWETLPAAGKSATQDWAVRARARLAAQEAAAALLAEAGERLGRM